MDTLLPFYTCRGIQQGCPISALLFLLVVETLANKMRMEHNIPGIKINAKEIKITQLADDTTLFLLNDNALSNAFNMLDKFYSCSGLKLNKSKTEIFYLGNTNQRPAIKNLNITKTFKALGIHFSKNTEDMISLNIDERYHKFKNVLNIWKQRDLSLKGKITILKSLALPQLTYVTNVIFVPSDFIRISNYLYGTVNLPK